MGILDGGVQLEARRAMQVEAWHPLTGESVTNLTLKKGEKLVLERGAGAYILKGRF
jgi:hypothetical protein